MFTKRDRNEIRKIRHERVRKKISGTPEHAASERVSQPEQHLRSGDRRYGRQDTLVSCSTLDPQIKGQLSELDKKGAGKLVGKTVAERALQAGIKKVVFDRGGYVYTGRVAEVAAGAREAGLDF
ncbi:MAG: 50S ribosomal protein L18 [Christensenellales bacterium]